VLHSSRFTNARDLGLVGKRVLIVGSGNSAFEIALDCLEHGARAELLVRSPQTVVPRWAMRRWQTFLYTHFRHLRSVPFAWLLLPAFAAATDLCFRLAARAEWGPAEARKAMGVEEHPTGALRRLATELRPPTIDVGTMEQIMSGALSVVRGEIESWGGSGAPLEVRFRGQGRVSHNHDEEAALRGEYDAVVFATGYKMFQGHAHFLDKSVLDVVGTGKDALRTGQAGVTHMGGESSVRGLWFCFSNLKGIRDSAPNVARALARAVQTQRAANGEEAEKAGSAARSRADARETAWMLWIAEHAAVVAAAVKLRKHGLPLRSRL
jgi:cation diffusion facilitator CzcD-associated flavoprotein CzcO